MPESELLKILEAANSYWALENGGVSSWEWCGNSFYDYLENWIAKSSVDPSGDWDFKSIAEKDICEYPSIEF